MMCCWNIDCFAEHKKAVRHYPEKCASDTEKQVVYFPPTENRIQKVCSMKA